MSDSPLLDTHAWVWWVTNQGRLDARTRARLNALPADARPYLSDISLWEVALLVDRKRLRFELPLRQWLEDASHPRTVRVLPITPPIAAETAELPASFRRDPADRIIVATSRVLDIPLITHDRAILTSRLARSWRALS